ncbi:Hint domain-containing protein [Cognatishimia sp. MH4019]|uniref:Hint domain-containing protein n=1 Tax=Cognatishimia sp. MH4019 TaxID=2854030 RepID=UPI001CD1CED4|nr:Hint domain-containing protein [Cognatishimia sp. MH4019]
MNRPSSVAAGLAVTPSSTLASGGYVRPNGSSQRSRPLLRKYEMTALDASGSLVDMGRLAPASLPFEDSFAAIARGALLATPDGPRAIEDILPGDMILTSQVGPQIVQWVGAMTVRPAPSDAHPAQRPLTRIAADSLGLNRPMPDLVLGPAARLLHQMPAFRDMYGTSACLTPAAGLVDGDAILEIRPVSPVKLFQVLVPIHDTMLVNGVEVETHHPGLHIKSQLSQDMLSLYLSMYPGTRSLEDFGPMAHPRLSEDDIASVNAA